MMTESMAKPKAKRTSRASGARKPAAKAGGGKFDDFEDDIPF